jgi:hypothetical protein
MAPDLRARTLLGTGVVLGLALAITGLLAPDPAAAPPGGAAAVVNGIPIARADLERALDAVATDRRSPAPPGEAERVLDRLVDEELLLQHAMALGLPRSDPQVRGQLVRAVVDLVVAEAEAAAPSEADLEAFYEQHQGYFRRPGRRRVERWFVRGTDAAARERAGGIVAALREGRPLIDGGDPTVPVPDSPLPEPKLEQYLGPTLARAAMRLGAGGVSEPIVATNGLHVLRVREVEPAGVPPFDEVRDAVADEYERRRGEDALRDYLGRLRGHATIVREDVG